MTTSSTPTTATASRAFRATATRRGFTLIEVLMAGAIFIVGTTAIISAWRSVVVSMEQQRRSVDAVAVAEDVLDDLRLRQRDHVDLAVGAHARFFSRQRRGVGAEAADGYRVDWTVHESEGHPFRRVDVVVTWRGSDKRAHVTRFPTFRPSG